MINPNSKYHFDNLFSDAPLLLDNFVVFQAGDLYCDKNTLIDTHEQIYFEISFVVSGSGDFYTNEVPLNVSEGHIYLSLLGDFHKIKSDSESPLRYHYISFSAKEGTVYSGIIRALSDKYANVQDRAIHLPIIFQNMSGILSELTHKQDYFLQQIESNIIQILVSLLRFSKNSALSLGAYETNSKQYLVFNVINYIDNNLTSITNLTDLSERFAFDYSYISSSFKSIIGQSLQDYVQLKKMEHAKLLILRENKSVTEIAEILHYSSIHNFSRAFKKVYGISPQQFKIFNRNKH